MTERVDHPQHYNKTVPGIECIDVVQHFNFNRGNAIKYIWRAGEKEGSDEIEDLKKSARYLQFEIERLEQKQVSGLVRAIVQAVQQLNNEKIEEELHVKEFVADEVHLDSYNIPQPDWSKAPAWAQWWAVDWNGTAWWFEYEPEANLSWQVWQCGRTGGEVQSAMKENVYTTRTYNHPDRIELGDTPWNVVKVQRKGEAG